MARLDENGLLYFWSKIKSILPSKTSDLTNDSGYITADDVPEGAAASTTTPKMDGTATTGTETSFARGDHVHPSDTTKVDKVSGKGLSTNDYTTAEQTKLAGIDEGANKYTHPTYTEASAAFIKVGRDASGHVVVGGAIEKSDITSLGIPAQDTTYEAASDSADGLMTMEEHTKLAGIAAEANAYTLPDATTSVKGGVIVGTNLSVSSGKISVANASTTAKGVVQLSDSTSSTSTSTAATSSAVKSAYDLANSKQSPATTLAGYGITDTYTKSEIDTKISSVLSYKGSVDTYSDLPSSDNTIGDVWNVAAADASDGIKAGDNVAWTGTEWDVLAGTVDLSAYELVADVITNAQIDTICAS